MTELIINIFFYIKYVPSFITKLGQGYPFDIACMCSLPNFFGVLFHILIIVLLIAMLTKNKELRTDRFFMFLLIGVTFSGISKLLDFYMNMRSGIGAFNGVYFSYPIDVSVGIFQLIGTAIILYTIISKLFYVHHQSSS